MNVTGYVNTKRMEYAVILMRQHPEYTMGAIAEACGIKSPATFIRNFRNVYGMTPSEFRQNIDE
jgi:AraC-like DNA-binding protein